MLDKDKKFDFFSLLSLRRRKSTRDKQYATFNRRMIAGTLDSIFLLVLKPLFDALAPLNTQSLQSDAPMPGTEEYSQWLMRSLLDPQFIHSWIYNNFIQTIGFCIFSMICWHFWSATPGKMLLRIKIVDATTQLPMNDRQIIVRALGYIISGACLFLGFFWIGINKRNQAWHDTLAHTIVIVKPWRKPPDITQEIP